VIPIFPARAVGFCDLEGPEAVEQVLESLVRSRQVGLELLLGHIGIMPENAAFRHTGWGNFLLWGDSLTAAAAPS
jgi:hypothetical protein